MSVTPFRSPDPASCFSLSTEGQEMGDRWEAGMGVWLGWGGNQSLRLTGRCSVENNRFYDSTATWD